MKADPTVPGDFDWPDSLEPLLDWQQGGFRLLLCDYRNAPGESAFGRQHVRYKFYHDGRLVFAGTDFSPSPIHAVDSPAAAGALLGFLSLRPGDTDSEYFDQYTPEQLEFANTYSEELSLYAEELETSDAWEEEENV